MKLRTFGYLVLLVAVCMFAGFGLAYTDTLPGVGNSLLLAGLLIALATYVADLLLFNRRHNRWHFR